MGDGSSDESMDGRAHGVVDLTDEVEEALPAAAPAGRHGCDVSDAVLRGDGELQSLLASARRARRVVSERSLALSQAKNTLHRCEAAASARTKALVDAAESKVDWVGRAFPWDLQLTAALRDVFNISSFRPLQREAVNASLSGRDVVAVLPTGAGKSLVYQLCALVSGGITVVVCPLLALMHDQAAQLRKLNVQAFCLEASATKEEVAQIFAQVLPPASKRRTVETALLFVTPERIMKSKKLMARLQVAYDESPRGLSHFVVDEAHCISSMGHDFRHDYAQLGVLRRVFPKVPCCCLTATATDKVVTDICSSLAIRPVVLRGCMDRPNLFYEVRAKPAGSDEVVCAIAEAIKGEFCGETGIVYVLSRRDAEVVSAALRTDHGIRAGCYHGDLPAGERRQTYRKWCDADLQVICATISFGLGIDKQNCRFIIHKELPSSVEGYYQESGRAGRDGRPAKCILYYRPFDVLRLASFVAGKGAARVPMVYESAKYASGHSTAVAARVGGASDAPPSAPNKRPRNERSAAQRSCRRAILAAAFGEVPPPRVDDTAGGGRSADEVASSVGRGFGVASACCDLCAGAATGATSSRVSVDVTAQARSAVRVLRSFRSRRPDDQLTMNALAADWGSAGKRGTELRGDDEPALPKVYDKDLRMDILLAALLESAVSLYFTYGMYNMQAYVDVGDAAPALEAGLLQVFVDVADTHPLVTGQESGKRKARRADE